MKQFFKSVDGTYIFYCCIKQWRYRERHRLHSERHQEELYLRFVTYKKQSYCKAKMLPGYSKFKQFSKRFDWNNIFTAINQRRHRERHQWHRERHQEEWYLRYVTCCMTEKKYLDLFKALITVGLLFTWILQSRLSIPEKWKAKQL